jgi:putative transposase
VAQSLTFVLVHVIFSTKNRIAFLQSPDFRSEVHAYLMATLRGLECEPVRVGGAGDHVHILTGLSRKISLAELVKNLKTSSTKIVKAIVISAGRADMVLSQSVNRLNNQGFSRG